MGGNRSDEKKPNLKSKKERKKGIIECEAVNTWKMWAMKWLKKLVVKRVGH